MNVKMITTFVSVSELVEAASSDLAARGDPNTLVFLHILNQFSEGLGSSRPARNVRMKRERAEGGGFFRFLIEFVEGRLPNLQGITRVPEIIVSINPAVSKRMPREFDQFSAVLYQ